MDVEKIVLGLDRCVDLGRFRGAGQHFRGLIIYLG